MDKNKTLMIEVKYYAHFQLHIFILLLLLLLLLCVQNNPFSSNFGLLIRS